VPEEAGGLTPTPFLSFSLPSSIHAFKTCCVPLGPQLAFFRTVLHEYLFLDSSMISDNEMGLFVFVFVFVFRWLLSLPSDLGS